MMIGGFAFIKASKCSGGCKFNDCSKSYGFDDLDLYYGFDSVTFDLLVTASLHCVEKQTYDFQVDNDIYGLFNSITQHLNTVKGREIKTVVLKENLNSLSHSFTLVTKVYTEGEADPWATYTKLIKYTNSCDSIVLSTSSTSFVANFDLQVSSEQVFDFKDTFLDSFSGENNRDGFSICQTFRHYEAIFPTELIQIIPDISIVEHGIRGSVGEPSLLRKFSFEIPITVKIVIGTVSYDSLQSHITINGIICTPSES